jgi:hypothetical protein
MTQTGSLNNKKKAARAGDKPRGARNGAHGGAHSADDSTPLVPLAIRVKASQADALEALSKELLVSKAVLVRKSLDLGIEWARNRAMVLSTAKPQA